MRLRVSLVLLALVLVAAPPAGAVGCSPTDEEVCGPVYREATELTAQVGDTTKDLANEVGGEAMERVGDCLDGEGVCPGQEALAACARFEPGTECQQVRDLAVDCVEGTSPTCAAVTGPLQECAELEGVCGQALADAQACAELEAGTTCAAAWDQVLFVGRCVFFNEGSPCVGLRDDAMATVTGCTTGTTPVCAPVADALGCLTGPGLCPLGPVEAAVDQCLNGANGGNAACEVVLSCLPDVGGPCDDVEGEVLHCASQSEQGPCGPVWSVVHDVPPFDPFACLNGQPGSGCEGAVGTVRAVEQVVLDCAVNEGDQGPCPDRSEVIALVTGCTQGAPPCDRVTDCGDGGDQCVLRNVLGPVERTVEDCLESGVCEEAVNCLDDGRTCDDAVELAGGAAGTVLGIAGDAIDLALTCTEDGNLCDDVMEFALGFAERCVSGEQAGVCRTVFG